MKERLKTATANNKIVIVNAIARRDAAIRELEYSNLNWREIKKKFGIKYFV